MGGDPIYVRDRNVIAVVPNVSARSKSWIKVKNQDPKSAAMLRVFRCKGGKLKLVVFAENTDHRCHVHIMPGQGCVLFHSPSELI
jgi:hypothetical protein